jgi:tRNA dimethylallyltransferase
MTMKKLLFGIVGPTACGKTAVSLLVAEHIGAEIISVDSVQVYRGMDIGSAKPTVEERNGIAHHLLDCVDIDTPGFSVSTFRDLAYSAIDDVFARGKLPLLVGGSGLYVSALTQPLNFAAPSDPATRKKFEKLYETSPENALKKLQEIDPPTAKRLHIHDKKRIVRALEVQALSGQPLSAYGNDFANSQARPARYASKMFGLSLPREALYQRIEQRVEHMMALGLEQEARRIYEQGFDRALPAMQSIGYKQLFAYFDGICSFEEAVALIKRDTRRFAKRQETWFKRNPDIEWIDMRAGVSAAAAHIEQAIRRECT